ncbi:hypothetical protein DPX16_8937 [Anabarilius grahami]|uniref:Uncharacterized protein n=1 Tax=Anabarilius grahami TaxID=495550 RepID=A0A3N0ZA47_ANAGA|nr:hypothetical protein DPX16_8937 [Anabarilius grahami]
MPNITARTPYPIILLMLARSQHGLGPRRSCVSDICSSRALEFQSNHMGPGCSLFFNTVWSEKTIFTPTRKSHVDSPSAAEDLSVEGVELTPMRHDPNEKPIGQLDKINLPESILRKEQCFLSACTHVQRRLAACLPGGHLHLSIKFAPLPTGWPSDSYANAAADF